jgi:hypothetical protein
MAVRTIDVLAAGPPSADLYDPAAPAWALAGGLAARGHSVQVTFPGPSETPSPPPGVTLAPFPPVTPHVGTFLGDAELAKSAGRRIRPVADAVVRDPAGLGSLGHRAGRHAVVAFVRGLAGDLTPAAPSGPSVSGGFATRVLGWGERRGVRRLEREALAEATTVYCTTAAQRERVREDYGVAADRLRLGAPTVPRGPEPPARDAARRLVGVPDDILLVVVLPPVDPATVGTAGPAVEAFRRTRPIFPGARLAVLGAADAAGPGTIALPSREAGAITSAIAAADVAVAFSPPATLDPGLVLALRAGVPTVAAPTVDLGDASDGVVRQAPTADAGELASVLAGLFADPEERRALGERARAFAKRFDPEHLAEELETTGAFGPG